MNAMAVRPCRVLSNRAAAGALALLLALSGHFSARGGEGTPAEAAPPVVTERPADPARDVGALLAAEARSRMERTSMNRRALDYLFSIQKDGMLGESRPKAVTAVFILACLSSGIRPDDPEHGPALDGAIRWILKSSTTSFLGGESDPNADHALAALALGQLVGTAPVGARNLELFRQAQPVLQHSLRIQDMGANPEYFGGWRPNDTTRVNDRVLSAWFLLHLRGAGLAGARVPGDAPERALEFLSASQKDASAEKSDDIGGFSVAANGLPVRSVTAAGLAALALFDEAPEMQDLARAWLVRHPPVWYGPHFYESGFFAVRGLWRTRDRDGGEAFRLTFNRLVRLLRERQEPDGAFPFPPGHGGPIVSMGKGYSTAMALLILNVDRGFLPMDQ